MSVRSFSGTHDWDPSVLNDTDAHVEGNADQIIYNIEAGRCPRCEGSLPELPEFPAGSRITECRSIPICGACGSDEAYEGMLGDFPSPAGHWPLQAVDIEGRRKRFEAQSRPGRIIVADGLITTERGDVITNPRNTGGWAQYGITAEGTPREATGQ